MPNDDAAREDGGDGDGDATAADAPEETYSARKITLVLALIILISQFQLAFCTKYEYTYEVEHIHEGGDGDTYAYNIWHGIVQLYEDGGEERGERAPSRHPHERRIIGRAAPALRRVRRVAAAPTSPPPASRHRLRLLAPSQRLCSRSWCSCGQASSPTPSCTSSNGPPHASAGGRPRRPAYSGSPPRESGAFSTYGSSPSQCSRYVTIIRIRGESRGDRRGSEEGR